jgi:ABC-2 type transport system ATP-binding protein
MPPIIEIAGLAKSYPGNTTPAVNGVSFSVERGEIFGLLGPNGAGKTTLISMLACLLAPSAGNARVAGYDLASEQSQVKRVIGLVPQDLALYPTLSTRQNLEYFGALYGLAGRRLAERVRAALAMVRLEERADDRLEALSGGMKRRANIAAGLLHEPQLLFLDEPTVGVDPQSRNFIFEGVEALKNAGLTVIYTTHYMEEAQRLCDRVAIIDHGAVIALDSPDAMITAHGGSIVIELGGNAAGAAAAVGALAGVRSVQHDDARLTIAAANPARVLGPVIEKIAGAGGEVTSVEVVNDNLESVFLDLTGRRLRD